MKTESRAEGIDALNAAMAALAEKSLRHLCAFIAAPMPSLWNSPACIDTLRQFLTARSQREVRLLFAEANGLAREHGALVALAQRLPSRLLLREALAEFALPASQSVILGDGALLLFDSGGHPAATFTEAGQHIRPLAERFADAWDTARPLSELRSLGI